MAEGPQVLLRTQWLRRWLSGHTILSASSPREDLTAVVEQIEGDRIDDVSCAGKHIFLRFARGPILHNHLLMRGRWRKLNGNLLFPPDGAWLSLYVGPHTVCNLNGQMLKSVTEEDVRKTIASLGPDAMITPYPADEIAQSIRTSGLPVSEALLDQSVVAGVGNTAKSEILYRARIHPSAMPLEIQDDRMAVLLDAIRSILRESYDYGGRWIHRVYLKTGQPCPGCATPVRSVRLKPSRRATYYCPSCQR